MQITEYQTQPRSNHLSTSPRPFEFQWDQWKGVSADDGRGRAFLRTGWGGITTQPLAETLGRGVGGTHFGVSVLVSHFFSERCTNKKTPASVEIPTWLDPRGGGTRPRPTPTPPGNQTSKKNQRANLRNHNFRLSLFLQNELVKKYRVTFPPNKSVTDLVQWNLQTLN